MKALIAVLLFAASSAFASPVRDFVAGFAQMDILKRSIDSFSVCSGLFALPAETYKAQLLELIPLFSESPEGAQYLTSTCEALWTTKYLDLQKTYKMKESTQASLMVTKLALGDFAAAANALRTQIRLYNDAGLAGIDGAPLAPHEILIPLQASDRELSETISQQTRIALQSNVAIAGMTAEIALLLRGIAVGGEVAGSAATGSGVGAAPGLVVAALSWVAVEGVDSGLWHYNESSLWSKVKKARALLDQPAAPRPIVLDEFYRATIRLGYFYTYDIYLFENSQSNGAAGNLACLPELDTYYGQSPSANYAGQFQGGGFCQDAATLWLSAGKWLEQKFPQDPIAQQVALRLEARAKTTYLIYKEAEAHRKLIGECGSFWNLMGCAH
jgi:hypothetical protein